MGKLSRDKGANYERELVNFLRDGGLDAKRVPLSGATDFQKGDITVKPEWHHTPYVGECKRRKQLPKLITEALGEHDFAAFRQDRGETLIVIRAELFRDLLQ